MGHIMKRLLAVLLTALAATPAAASSSDIVVWSNTAGWVIASDTTFGNTCFLASTFDNGVTLRLGFQPKGSKFGSDAVLVVMDFIPRR